MKEILSRTDAGKKFDASQIVTRISNAKNAFQSPEEYAEREGDDYDEMTKIVYPKYQSALKSFRAFDFDDLVCEVAHRRRRVELCEKPVSLLREGDGQRPVSG